jgi:hypothetical protein
MNVSQVMSVVPVLIELRASSCDAVFAAERNNVHHLMVVDDSELVGVVCRCDLELAGAADSVARWMRAPPLTIGATEPIELAARIMLDCGIGCLVVVDDTGTLRGIVSRRDLRDAGALPDVLGIDRCAVCGTSHHLRPPDCPDAPAICFACQSQGLSPRSHWHGDSRGHRRAGADVG